MRKLIRIAITLAVMVVLLASTATALATPNTKLNVFQDVSDGGPELRDTVGTGSYGFANTNQDDATNDLRVVGVLKGVAPNTIYRVTIWAGPTHIGAITMMYQGTVTTNKKGNANTGAIIIPAASLYGPSGYVGDGHIDFDNMSIGIGTYVAQHIPYVTP